MKTIYLFLMISSLSQSVWAQKKTSTIWINSMDATSSTIKATLYQLQDSFIRVLPYSYQQPAPIHLAEKINIHTINTIRLRKKGNIGKGVLFGSLSGLTAAGLIFLKEQNETVSDPYNHIEEDSYIPGFLAYSLVGIAFAVPGASIGAGLGTIRVKITIGGKKMAYLKNHYKLKKHLIQE